MKQAGAAEVSSEVWVERLCMQAQRLRAILRLSAAARGDPERLLGAVCSVAPSLLAADGVAVFVEDGQGQLRIRAAAGFPERFTRWASLPSVEMSGLRERVGPVVRLVGEPASWPCPEALLPSGARTAVWVAIEQRGRVAGGIFLGRVAAEELFSDDDCLFAEVLAEYLSARLGELALARRLDRVRRARLRDARRAALGELAGAAAAGILESLESLDGASAEHEAQAHRELHDAERLARSLSLLGGAGPHEELRDAPLEEILAATSLLLEPQLAAERIHFDLVWEEDLPLIRCRPGEIGQLLLQLVANARDSLNRRFPDGGDDKQLRLEARRAGDLVEIEVWDRGVGLSEVQVERLGDASRAGGTGVGAGLGLMLCREVIAAHQGSLTVESKEGGWARFVIGLPLEVLP